MFFFTFDIQILGFKAYNLFYEFFFRFKYTNSDVAFKF